MTALSFGLSRITLSEKNLNYNLNKINKSGSQQKSSGSYLNEQNHPSLSFNNIIVTKLKTHKRLRMILNTMLDLQEHLKE